MGLPLFHFAGERSLRLFLLSRNNSVRFTNAQPAPTTGLFTGFGVRPQQVETAASGIAGNRSFESLWEQRHCLPNSAHSCSQYQLFCSISTSIMATSSLGRISRAFAIFQMVSKFACLSPFSIIVRCVRAIPAKPLNTS